MRDQRLRAASAAMPPSHLPPRFAAPTTATASTAAAAEAATAGARRHRLRLVNGQVPAAEVVVVELIDGFLRLLVGRHLDEPESACAASRHVAHDLDALDGATSGEELLQVLLSRAVREVAHVKFSTHR
jgi:hypothetical protein